MAKSLLELQAGDSLGVSDWITLDQNKIDQFAHATGDHQWIHVDAHRCKTQSPFGSTIAHGLLSTALMPSVFYEMISLDPESQTLLNYGIDTLRFLEPVKVDKRIRYKVSLSSTQQKQSGTLFRFDCEVEIEGSEKPAMVGCFLMLLVG
jgi:acyl dehydratase